MISSRKIEDLHPIVQVYCNKFIEECKKVNIDLLITSTYRDNESQNELYKIGRTVKGANVSPKRPMGSKVTNARGGQSFHNFKVAFDVVPLVNGKADWNSKRWEEIGKIGKKIGLTWAGDWISFKEMPHFQYTGKIEAIGANYQVALKHFQNNGKLEDLIH